MSGALAQAFYAALNARDDAAVRALMRADCQTGLPGVPPGPEGYLAIAWQMREAFPDLCHHVTDGVEAADGVAMVTSTTGTHAGAFLGHAASGRGIRVAGIDLLRFRDGRLASRTGVFDTVTMLHQLGLYRQGPGR